MARRRLVIATLAAAALPLAARSETAPAEVAAALPDAQLRGRGTLRFLGLRIYDARLWVAPGFAPERFERAPLALELQYARTLYGRLIAERSLEEMKRHGSIAPEQGERWLERMKALFPDVKDGDRLTGLQKPGEATHFFFNGRPVGDVTDPVFTQRFFSIWLGPQTSEPSLRQSLLGGS